MKTGKRAGLFFVLCLLVLLCGCSPDRKGEEKRTDKQTEEETERVQIGLSVDSFVIERWVRDRDIFVTTAKELGAEVNVQDAGGDSKEQIRQIEYLIQKDVDVLVVIARDCNVLQDVIRKAKKEGIRIISYDRMLCDAGSDLCVTFDNRKVGVLMAQALIEAIPEGGDIFMIQGSEDDDNVPRVREGFEDTVKNSHLRVVYTANCDGWIAEQAVRYVEEGLRKYPDVKGIMCGNDDIASRVVQTLAENRLAGKVVVVGQDGDVAACQRIVEGTQYMTAFKSVEKEAGEAAKYAVRLGLGEELTGIRETLNDGTFDVVSKILEPVAVTKTNIEEVIIDGGYHQREDVYLNVSYENGEETD